jgi:hypothetical protein
MLSAGNEPSRLGAFVAISISRLCIPAGSVHAALTDPYWAAALTSCAGVACTLLGKASSTSANPTTQPLDKRTRLKAPLGQPSWLPRRVSSPAHNGPSGPIR